MGVSIVRTNHYPGSVGDIDIMKKDIEFHEGALETIQYELNIRYNGPLVERHADYWDILAYKGYIGMEKTLTAPHQRRSQLIPILISVRLRGRITMQQIVLS